MDVDASVAVTRTVSKAGDSMPAQAGGRPPAASVQHQQKDRNYISGLPGPSSGVRLQAAVTLFETQFMGLGQRLFEAYRKWVPGLNEMEVSFTSPSCATEQTYRRAFSVTCCHCMQVLLSEAYPEEPR